MPNSEYMPFHMAHPIPYYDMEQQNEQQASLMKSYYPQVAMAIQSHVERECDKMEYDGSMMYDEYPDKNMLEQIAHRIARQVQKQIEDDDSQMKEDPQMFHIHMDSSWIPVEDSRMPMDDCRKPMHDHRMPMEDDCRKPMHDHKMPMDDGCRKPMCDHRMPMEDDCRKPMDDCRMPMDNCEKPMDNNRMPIKECRRQMGNSRRPGCNCRKRVDNCGAPMDYSRNLLEECKMPMESSRDIIQNHRMPKYQHMDFRQKSCGCMEPLMRGMNDSETDPQSVCDPEMNLPLEEMDPDTMEIQGYDRRGRYYRYRRNERFNPYGCRNPFECGDLARVLLLNEIFRRRCRHGNCGRFY